MPLCQLQFVFWIQTSYFQERNTYLWNNPWNLLESSNSSLWKIMSQKAIIFPGQASCQMMHRGNVTAHAGVSQALKPALNIVFPFVLSNPQPTDPTPAVWFVYPGVKRKRDFTREYLLEFISKVKTTQKARGCKTINLAVVNTEHKVCGLAPDSLNTA